MSLEELEVNAIYLRIGCNILEKGQQIPDCPTEKPDLNQTR